MGHQSTTKKVSKKHRVLRLVLRRKPCFYISLCQVTLLLVLISSVAGLVIGFRMVKHKRLRLDKEDEILRSKTKQVTFAHCRYEPMNFTFEGWNRDFCALKARNYAYSYRHFKLIANESTTQPSCIDRHQQMECHEYLAEHQPYSGTNNATTSLISWDAPVRNVKLCHGLFQVDAPKDDHQVKTAPVYKTEQISMFMNQNLTLFHASELFVRCPICTPKSKTFRFDGNKKCFRNLGTIDKGWPAVAYNCDDFISIPC